MTKWKNDREVEVTLKVRVRGLSFGDEPKQSRRVIENDEVADFAAAVASMLSQHDLVAEAFAGSECFLVPVKCDLVGYKDAAT